MNAFIRFWAGSVLRFRVAILIFAAGLIGLGIFGAKDIAFDNTNEKLFVEGDPALIDYDKLVDLFGDNEYLVIGIEAREEDEDVFEPETLLMIESITDFLESHPTVTQTRSLSRYQYTHSEDDSLSTDDLIDDIRDFEQSAELREQAKNILRNEPLAIGNLITEDFRHTRIAARVEYKKETAEHHINLVKDVYAFLDEQSFVEQGYDIHLSGQPLVNARFEMHTREDSKILNPAMAVLMLIILFISFRSATAMLTPWLVIGAGIATTLGIQGFLKFPHTVVDSALIPTLIIIGIGVSVHVLVEFFHKRGDGLTAKEAAEQATIVLWKPAFFTALTTSVGFIALSVTKIAAVREFALLGAIGPILLFVFAMTILPALLSFLNKVSVKTQSAVDQGVISRFTRAVPDFVQAHRRLVVITGLGFLAFALYAVPAIKVDNNFIQYFKKNNPARQDMVYFDDYYKGVMPLEIILDSGVEGGVKEPEFLRKVESLQNFLEQSPKFGAINSIVDYLKQINRALNNDDPAFYRLPDSANAVAQFLFLYQNTGPDEDLSDIKDFDDRYVRLNIPLMNMPASEMTVELERVQNELDETYSELNAVTTGGMKLFHEQNIYTGEGMYKSFSIALLVISLCFVLVFRSIKYGLLALVPSILPILIVGGAVGLIGVHLDLGTMIVGAMTMGIAVDDAIHVLSRYLLAKKQGATTDGAIRRAMNESGRAVVFSSIVLVLGFSVLMFGQFAPIIYVGMFGAAIMFLALLGDLIFLPAILYWIDGKDSVTTSENTSIDTSIAHKSV